MIDPSLRTLRLAFTLLGRDPVHMSRMTARTAGQSSSGTHGISSIRFPITSSAANPNSASARSLNPITR